MPTFTRSDVASVLGVTRLTIANREKKKVYPQPRKDLNGYRVYNLDELFNLQLITFGQCDAKPIIELLYDKGYTDPRYVTNLVSDGLKKKLAYE